MDRRICYRCKGEYDAEVSGSFENNVCRPCHAKESLASEARVGGKKGFEKLRRARIYAVRSLFDNTCEFGCRAGGSLGQAARYPRLVPVHGVPATHLRWSLPDDRLKAEYQLVCPDHYRIWAEEEAGWREQRTVAMRPRTFPSTGVSGK